MTAPMIVPVRCLLDSTASIRPNRRPPSAAVNDSAVNVVAAPDATQTLINISANGHSSTTSLAPHSGAVFLPDFDPGALQTLLALGAASNNRDLWAIMPKGAGSVAAVQLATYADEQGTLDGKPGAPPEQ